MLRLLSALLLLLGLVVAPVATAAGEPDGPAIADGTSGGFILDMPEFDWGGQEAEDAAPQPGDPETGVPFCCDKPKFAATAAYIVALEAIPWYFNRHVADDKTAVITGSTWTRNLREGWEWDNNDFKTGCFVESDPHGIGRQLGIALLKELRSRGCYFFSAIVYGEAAETDFYRSLGFCENTGHKNFTIDARPYVPEGDQKGEAVDAF